MAKKSYNIRGIELDENHQKKIEKLAIARAKICKTKEDATIMEFGYEIGLSGGSIPESYKDNLIFKNGYDRGKRVKNVQGYEKKKEIVEKMATENIPLEDAPEEIKKDQTLVTHYKICQIKNKKTTGKTK